MDRERDCRGYVREIADRAGVAAALSGILGNEYDESVGVSEMVSGSPIAAGEMVADCLDYLASERRGPSFRR